jgi:hypothetical protein
MWKWIVGVLLILGVIGGGLSRLLMALRPNLNRSFESSLGKTNLIILGLVNLVFYSVGFVVLLMDRFSPLLILLVTSLIPSLLFVLMQLKAWGIFPAKSSNK